MAYTRGLDQARFVSDGLVYDATLRNLELMEERGVMAHAARMGERLQSGLERVREHPLVGNVRGESLIAGIEFVADRDTHERFPAEDKIAFKAAAACLEEGLVVRALPGDTIAVCPPLIIDDAQVDELVEKMLRGLNRLEKAAPAR